MTNKYVERLKGTKTHVLDTRKTTPGLRMLEKQAVKIGGGMNHRIGLFDMILLKDNHIDFCGGITNAITRCHEYLKEKGLDLKIEIEVRNFDELAEAMNCGGITFDTIRDYAECGVDCISVGALTHSVKGLDMSFKACD